MRGGGSHPRPLPCLPSIESRMQAQAAKGRVFESGSRRFPPCTMLEVKKHSMPELKVIESRADLSESAPREKRHLSDVVEMATSPAVLHEVINKRRRSVGEDTGRYRVKKEEQGSKRFLCIDVLPHFL